VLEMESPSGLGPKYVSEVAPDGSSKSRACQREEYYHVLAGLSNLGLGLCPDHKKRLKARLSHSAIY
jgi:hypothetical protein